MATNYDTVNAYDTINFYDTGGGIVIVANTDVGWQAVLNQLAGTSGLGENEAANIYAYGKDKGVGLERALCDKAGLVGAELNASCNAIAGTTGLEALKALNRKAGNS